MPHADTTPSTPANPAAALDAALSPDAKSARPKRAVGPHETAALKLHFGAQVVWRSTTMTQAVAEIAQPDTCGYAKIVTAGSQPVTEVPPLLLPIPSDHAQNHRTDQHSDFADLKAQGLIRDRDGEIIEIRSIWHAWGAYRMDKFFQAYCKVASRARERGETQPSDSVRDWVAEEAARQGMTIEFAHRIIRDGCTPQSLGNNAAWWRGASIKQ